MRRVSSLGKECCAKGKARHTYIHTEIPRTAASSVFLLFFLMGLNKTIFFVLARRSTLASYFPGFRNWDDVQTLLPWNIDPCNLTCRSLSSWDASAGNWYAASSRAKRLGPCSTSCWETFRFQVHPRSCSWSRVQNALAVLVKFTFPLKCLQNSGHPSCSLRRRPSAHLVTVFSIARSLSSLPSQLTLFEKR